MAGAKQKARELHEMAMDNLGTFGEEAQLLRDLSLYIIERNH
jgi:farnesyl diphosphate synthase